ncbi:MAG: DNA glycosylase AlkZ-like family protein [Acidobacteriaceae bacterium]
MATATRKSATEKKAASARKSSAAQDVLELFHPVTAEWFHAVFERPTAPQRQGWPVIARGESTLILAPTGTGKTLTAFLWCLDKLMLQEPAPKAGCRVIYISPLKALAVDVERNLRSPLIGMANMAQQHGVSVHLPEISVRTGDTPQKERSRFRRHPGEILITTPESLYLLLTSDAAETLRGVETVIIDEIHALVPTKRGTHLALSLERLEALVRQNAGRPLQRIGLSATQRPLEEVARFLGGAEPYVTEKGTNQTGAAETEEIISSIIEEEPVPSAAPRFRPVTIVNASAKKRLDLSIEVPVEDMAKLGELIDQPSGPTAQGPKRTSIWTAIHPRLLELVRAHESTLIFVNNRRSAEKLAGAMNELAGEPLARAHHGSLAAPQRSEIEELLKEGRIKALVATSSLELGIDMGAIDLVIQIEAPPSVAAGMQRIGRAGHQVDAVSNGIIFPKYRADLIACAAATEAMHAGHVEATRFLRNPLDVLAQQMVAIIAQPPLPIAEKKPRKKVDEDKTGPGISEDELYRIVRSSAPFAQLSRGAFEGVLDMLAGRYPSDEFAELRPRITWDRIANHITPRSSAKRLAILNGGTIPDRGLYGVFLSHTEGKSVRVGELDEEMVFENHAGDTFILGASTWRVDEITHDKVLVSPAPGEPGKMPFWKGDGVGRPIEFGRRIGALVRELRGMPRQAAISKLVREHDLAQGAAENLLRFLADQELATTAVPDDRNLVIERCRDELGDWRVCVLTPFGSRVHAPWAMAVTAKLRAAGGPDVETMWAEDGFVVRFPDTDEPPDAEQFLLEPQEAAELVMRQLGSSALFAAKFRESAARALLLPRRRAEGRTPLWQQRKRAYDLLSVASKYASFPMLLEAYRECLRDVFDIPAFTETLRHVGSRSLRVHVADTRTPSPFAASLLFSYVANYIYDGDAPLAERRAQALTIDQEQLRELLGDADLRELLDADAIATTEEQLQCLAETYRARNMDGVHDLLLRLGDLTREELLRRCSSAEVAVSADRLMRARRALEIRIGGGKRLIAIEDAARYRDALGVALPPGVPTAFLTPQPEAVVDLLRRYARTHGPFTTQEAAARFGLAAEQVEAVLQQLVQAGRVAEGGFRPEGLHREWCDVEVLRMIRRKSLAKLRREVEPVEQQTLARMMTHWQGLLQPRRGLDSLLDVIENLQGAPLPASLLETEILPARMREYKPADLDTLIAAGEVVWCGLEPLGERDGRVALYLADKLMELWPVQVELVQNKKQNKLQKEKSVSREEEILEYLRQHGASFFSQMHEGVGGGYPGETLEALWNLVWRGQITNDALHALRAYCERPLAARPARRIHNQSSFRSRRTTPPTAQGRWSLHPVAFANGQSRSTQWSHATAQQLLHRYGVVLRETAALENLPGGFSAVYDVLKALEESGRIRRGYFAAGLGATQFALPAALDMLRSLRTMPEPEKPEMLALAATDPANPYGAILHWPAGESVDEGQSTTMTRSVGAKVILRNGALVGYMRRANPNLQIFLPVEEPARSHAARDLAAFLVEMGQREMRREQAGSRGGMLIATVNGVPVAAHFMARYLLEAGFQAAPTGFNLRRMLLPLGTAAAVQPHEVQ